MSKQELESTLKEKGFNCGEIRKFVRELNTRIGTGSETNIIKIQDSYLTTNENRSILNERYGINSFVPVEISCSGAC
jgi:hypothetical protein